MAGVARRVAGALTGPFFSPLGADLSLLQEDLQEDADGCECARPAAAAAGGPRGAGEGRAGAGGLGPARRGGGRVGEAWPWAGRGRGSEGTLRFLEETARPCRWREMPRAALPLGCRPAGRPSLQPQISVGSGTARRAVLKEESSRQDFEIGIRGVFSSSERLPAALPAALLRKEEAVTEEGVGSEWRGAPVPRGPPFPAVWRLLT